MRLFVALDIEDDIRARIHRFVQGVAGFAPDARWIKPQSLHITLKFIGEQPLGTLEPIQAALNSVKFQPIEIKLAGYGFFPGPQRPRTFWTGIDAGPNLASLANAVDEALIPLAIPKETHFFNPHITLARPTGRPSRQRKDGDGQFTKLRDKLSALPAPEFGTMTAREFFLYESQLSSSGSAYTKIARFEFQ